MVAALGAISGFALVASTSGCGRTELDFSGGVGSGLGGSAGHMPVGGGGGSIGPPGSGGSAASGGRAATGGRPGTGGIHGTGGAPATGGFIGSGGHPDTGGAIGTGGLSASGGGGGNLDGGVRDAPADLARDVSSDTGGRDTSARDGSVLDLPPPTPGRITCGSEVCDLTTQSCCVSLTGVGTRCLPVGMLGGSSCGGASLTCDEPADCARGASCCFGFQAGGGAPSLGSRCVAPRACVRAAGYLVCRTDADCSDTVPICCPSSLGFPVCQRTCP